MRIYGVNVGGNLLPVLWCGGGEGISAARGSHSVFNPVWELLLDKLPWARLESLRDKLT